MPTTVASAMPCAVASAMPCAVASAVPCAVTATTNYATTTMASTMPVTVSGRVLAVMRNAFSTDNPQPSRAVTHATLFANVVTTGSHTVPCDTSGDSSAIIFYTARVIMSQAMSWGANPAVTAAGDSVGKRVAIVMCWVVGHVVV